jgi:uncharacterized membrane protein
VTAPAHSTLPAKNPAHPLAGPYGHPVHPVAVLVPIGAWVSSLALDLLSRASRGRTSEGYARSSRALIGVGLFGAGGAALTGLLDYTTIPAGTRAKKFATAHLLMNVTAVASYGLNFLRRDPDERVTDDAFRLSLVTVSALAVSGIIGGELAYRYGVRVADERTQAQGFTGAHRAVDPYVTEGVHTAGNVTAHQGIDPY